MSRGRGRGTEGRRGIEGGEEADVRVGIEGDEASKAVRGGAAGPGRHPEDAKPAQGVRR